MSLEPLLVASVAASEKNTSFAVKETDLATPKPICVRLGKEGVKRDVKKAKEDI